MAINFSKYSCTDIGIVCTAIKNVIDATGQYDDVTNSSNTVTLKKNNTTYAVFTPGVLQYGSFSATGGLTTLAHLASQTYVFIGSTSKGAMIGFHNGSTILATTVFVKSKNSKNMIFANVFSTTLSSEATPFAMTEDSSVNEPYPLTVSPSGIYSSIAGLCAQSPSSITETADGAYFLTIRESIIPNPLNSALAAFRKITIGDKTYLTDGFFCLDD